jgi:hypothetical protein
VGPQKTPWCPGEVRTHWACSLLTPSYSKHSRGQVSPSLHPFPGCRGPQVSWGRWDPADNVSQMWGPEPLSSHHPHTDPTPCTSRPAQLDLLPRLKRKEEVPPSEMWGPTGKDRSPTADLAQGPNLTRSATASSLPGRLGDGGRKGPSSFSRSGTQHRKQT